VLNEPVRGTLPEPSFFSLSGLEMLRAYMRGQVAGTPLFRLLAPMNTQASSGTSVLRQPLSPWFEINDGFMDLTATAAYNVEVTALTSAPPGTYVRTVSLSLRYLRPCTVDHEAVIARGRILHAGSSFTTVETLIEDALGRTVAHGTGSVVLTPMEPPPPPLSRPLQPVDDPVYPTPDPARRPMPPREVPRAGQPPTRLPPIGEFLGMQLLEGSDGRVRVALPTTEWFCRLYREVASEIIGVLGDVAGITTIPPIARADERFVVINSTTSFTAPVIPDGRPLVADAIVRHRRGNLVISECEITDADGQTVAIAQSSGLLLERTARPAQRATDRRLLSVLFTDVVGSTERARQLGDARWRELLDEHNALVRRQLELHKGREVKTTGDGFLATFDSPTRAVECARAIRDAMRGLGLEIRAGIHTGDCELVGGDVAGLAVHVASRVQSAAQPGEILVSSTVRDLIAGSDLVLVERGVHELKGLDGTWTLLAVEA